MHGGSELVVSKRGGFDVEEGVKPRVAHETLHHEFRHRTAADIPVAYEEQINHDSIFLRLVLTGRGPNFANA